MHYSVCCHRCSLRTDNDVLNINMQDRGRYVKPMLPKVILR